jgi:hypothetical protein
MSANDHRDYKSGSLRRPVALALESQGRDTAFGQAIALGFRGFDPLGIWGEAMVFWAKRFFRARRSIRPTLQALRAIAFSNEPV